MGLNLFKVKPLDQLVLGVDEEGRKLKRTLKAIDLIAIGIGCIIGVGIFVLPGQEAAVHAGPGIILSFALAGLACGCAALCYAELASMIPVAGSAYTYAYASFGELIAWIIGWDLVLEYVVGASLVSIGWSGYCVSFLNHFLAAFDMQFPQVISNSPWALHQGIVNFPAVLIIFILSMLLARGIKESAKVNAIAVIIKIVVILIFIALAVWHINPANWQPFAPFGFAGIRTAAAIVFLAYVGFDVVSTAAEETINPQKDMPIGILGSLIIASMLYMAVAAIMTGVVPYSQFRSVAEPIALVLDAINMPKASMLISLGAIAGMTSVILVLLMGQARILFVMSRDGLLPEIFSTVHKKFKSPIFSTIITGTVVSIAAGFTPIDIVAELCSIGTLFAFTLVCAGVLILRITRSDIPRNFKAPWYPLIPALGVFLCLYLMKGLPLQAWLRFIVWLVIGLAIYAGFGYRNSKLRRGT